MSVDRKHLKGRISVGMQGLAKIGKHLVERGMGSHAKNTDRDRVASKGKLPPGKGGGGKGKGKG